MKKTIPGQDRVEILIAELLSYIRRGKLLIIACVCLAIVAAVALYAVSPVVYRSSVAVAIGKIGNTQIESEVGIRNYISRVSSADSGKAVVYTVRNISSSTVSENDLDGFLAVDVVAEDESGPESEKLSARYAEMLVERHKKVFTESLNRIRKISPLGGNPALMTLDTYNFPSSVKSVMKPVALKRLAGRFDLQATERGGMAAASIVRIAFLAGFAAFVCATLLWLCVEYVREGGISRIMRGMRR